MKARSMKPHDRHIPYQRASWLILLLIGLLNMTILQAAGPARYAGRPGPSLARTGAVIDMNNHDISKENVHTGNKIATVFYNYGAIASWDIPNRVNCGIYPIGSGRSYMAEFTPLVAAEAKMYNNRTTYIISDGVSASTKDASPYGYIYQFLPQVGYSNPDSNLIAMSDDTLTWPVMGLDPTSNWAEPPGGFQYDIAVDDTVWPGQYGLYARADQESYFVIDDLNNDEFKFYPFKRPDFIELTGNLYTHPDSLTLAWLVDPDADFSGARVIDEELDSLYGDTWGGSRPDVLQVHGDRYYIVAKVQSSDSLLLRKYPGPDITERLNVDYTVWNGGKRGVGALMEVRGYQWSHPAADDIIIWTYWIHNTSDIDHRRFVFGMYGDADVGDDGDQRDDDAEFDDTKDIVYQWDHDLWSSSRGGFRPAYFGWKYLESPGNPLDGFDNDNDGMVDERQDDGIDNDGDWNINVDDVGQDGLGPFHPEYVAPDAGEGDGVPTVGEPNFEFADNDESDQIGLTSFAAAAWPGIDPQNDATTWSQLAPGNFDDIVQTVDLTFMYGSAYFELPQHESRKFAVAMLFGVDFDDILRNAETMQQIYNADYNFAKPPVRPTVYAVPGDHRVTLYWDSRAEETRDPIYAYDFEGYKIYRSTDPNFLEVFTITDAYGVPNFYKPIAQFDKDNGLTGPHPLAIGGLQMNMGTDNGVVHSWTDTTVENGQSYYYAVVAYDAGYDDDWYERGISELDNLLPISPSECNKYIEVDALGNVVEKFDNTVKAVPNAPSINYIPPSIVADETPIRGSGDWEIKLVDPHRIKPNNDYLIHFKDWSNDLRDNDGDWETWTDDSLWIQLSPTLQMAIPPLPDTLNVDLDVSNFDGIVGVDTSTVTTFTLYTYVFVTTEVLYDTTNGYHVVVPDTQFQVLPTLRIWDGWEELHDDLGCDGCNDEYEDGMGGCSETPLNLGGDPNEDNYHPILNDEGTQANGRPDLGEPDVDTNDPDEVPRHTTHFSLVNLTTGRTVVRESEQLYGADNGLTVEGIRPVIDTDAIKILEEESGWTRAGINLYATYQLEDYNTDIREVTMPSDIRVTLTDTVIGKTLNFKDHAFLIEDITLGDTLGAIYLPTDNDTIPRHRSTIFPIYEVGENKRVAWTLYFWGKAADISDIIYWKDGITLFSTEAQGIGMYNGNDWTNMTAETNGLISNNVNHFLVDASNRLWVSFVNGIARLGMNGWETYIEPVGDKEATVEYVDIVQDDLGRIWAATLNGVRYTYPNSGVTFWMRYNSSMDSIAYDEDGNLGSMITDKFTCLTALEDGDMAFGTTTKGMYLWDEDTHLLRLVNKDNSDLPDNGFYCIEYEDGVIYLGTKKGLAIYDVAQDTILQIYDNGDGLPDKKIRSMALDAENHRVYIGTDDGLGIIYDNPYDLRDGIDSAVTYTNEDIIGLRTNDITTVRLINDKLWVGTGIGASVCNDPEKLADWEDFFPKVGDSYIIKTSKPFSHVDTLRFSTTAMDTLLNDQAALLNEVAVVPNPYVVTASWEPTFTLSSGRGLRKVDFINLPQRCTIRIFTVSGKLVRTLEHEGEITNGTESWNLLSRDGLEIAYGIYIYHVEAPGIGTKVGKLAVIK